MTIYKKPIAKNRAEIRQELDGESYLYDATLQEIIAFGTEKELREYGKEMQFIN